MSEVRACTPLSTGQVGGDVKVGDCFLVDNCAVVIVDLLGDNGKAGILRNGREFFRVPIDSSRMDLQRKLSRNRPRQRMYWTSNPNTLLMKPYWWSTSCDTLSTSFNTTQNWRARDSTPSRAGRTGRSCSRLQTRHRSFLRELGLPTSCPDITKMMQSGTVQWPRDPAGSKTHLQQ
ncbi:uncharacterized protein LOC144123941 [Amblyomma americanum]